MFALFLSGNGCGKTITYIFSKIASLDSFNKKEVRPSNYDQFNLEN